MKHVIFLTNLLTICLGFEGKYEDFRELAIRITLAFTVAAILVVVVAPIFGYKIDLLVSQINNLSQSSDPVTSPGIDDPAYGGYAAAEQDYAGAYTGYPVTSAGARSLLDSWNLSGVLNR